MPPPGNGKKILIKLYVAVKSACHYIPERESSVLFVILRKSFLQEGRP